MTSKVNGKTAPRRVSQEKLLLTRQKFTCSKQQTLTTGKLITAVIASTCNLNRNHHGNGPLEQYNIATILLRWEPKFLQHVISSLYVKQYITDIFYKPISFFFVLIVVYIFRFSLLTLSFFALSYMLDFAVCYYAFYSFYIHLCDWQLFYLRQLVL